MHRLYDGKRNLIIFKARCLSAPCFETSMARLWRYKNGTASNFCLSVRYTFVRALILSALALISAYLYDIYVHYLTRCVHTTERDFRPRSQVSFANATREVCYGGPLFLFSSVYPRRRNWFGQQRNCLFYEPPKKKERESLTPLLGSSPSRRERERNREGVEVKNNVFFTLLLRLPFDSRRFLALLRGRYVGN